MFHVKHLRCHLFVNLDDSLSKIVVDITSKICYYDFVRNCYNGMEESMKKLMVQAITESGCCVYTDIKVRDDYTMNEVVKEIKRLRFIKFRLVDSMKTFAEVQR